MKRVSERRYAEDVAPMVVRNQRDREMRWGVQPCEYTWEELSKAAEGLDPNKQPLRRKRRLSVEAEFDVREAQNLLIRTSMLEVYKEKFTEEDFKIFERLVKKARQDLDLHKDYLNNTKIIKHYSSVERVKEKNSPVRLNSRLGGRNFGTGGNLENQVLNNTLTRRTLQLADDPMLIKNKFKTEDATFTRKMFHFLPSVQIANGLEQYFNSASSLSFVGKEKAIANYMKYISVQRKLEKERYRKRMKTIPIGLDTPFHFLVYKERDEGCPIQEPLLELTKIRAYFGCFLIMPTVIDMIRLEGRTYHTLMRKAVQLEEGGEVEFVDPEEAESEEDDGI